MVLLSNKRYDVPCRTLNLSTVKFSVLFNCSSKSQEEISMMPLPIITLYNKYLGITRLSIQYVVMQL